MSITLEKIELVKDRTGVSYKEAKEALEATDGSVVDAIINIEEGIDEKSGTHFNGYAESVVETVKALVRKGNVSKILVKRDEEVILNLPVNVGILGTIIAPFAMLVGVIAAFGTKCVIEVIKDDGTIIDVSEMACDAADYAKERSSEFVDGFKDKSNVIIDELREKGEDVYETAKGKSSDVYESVKEKADSLKDKVLKDEKESYGEDNGDAYEESESEREDEKEK